MAAGEAGEAGDLCGVDVADVEVGVQRLGERERRGAEVGGGEADGEGIGEGYGDLSACFMGPGGVGAVELVAEGEGGFLRGLGVVDDLPLG